MKRLFLLLIPLALAGCQHAPPLPSTSSAAAIGHPGSPGPYVFGWGDQDESLAQPRGGSTRGAPVLLAPGRALPLSEIASATDNSSAPSPFAVVSCGFIVC